MRGRGPGLQPKMTQTTHQVQSITSIGPPNIKKRPQMKMALDTTRKYSTIEMATDAY